MGGPPEPPSPLFTHRVHDSEFRGFVVPAAEREALVAALSSPTYAAGSGHGATAHHSALPPDVAAGTPCVHVPSAGGSQPPSDDGEPHAAGVAEALLQELPPGSALVVWRRFGGTPLGVRSGGLREAYVCTAREAAHRHRTLASPAWAAFLEEPAAAPLAPHSFGRASESVPSKEETALLTHVAPPPRLVVPLPVPCVLYDPCFLNQMDAGRLLVTLRDSIDWERPGAGSLEERALALFGDVKYTNRDGKGYASGRVTPWAQAPPALLELRELAEAWHQQHTGLRAGFDVCLLNYYADGRDRLAWHADREEIDPLQNGPRATPIASVSLGAERLFAFAPKWDPRAQQRVREAAEGLASSSQVERHAALERMRSLGFGPLRLAHGSLCVMENACQLLYKHALLPEHGIDGIRINATFRAKRPVELAKTPPPRQPPGPPQGSGSGKGAVPVGPAPGLDHRAAQSWKDTLYHPFESPFADDAPAVAAARYQTWLLAQPTFLQWVCGQLSGRALKADNARDELHARLLEALVRSVVWKASEAAGAAGQSRL